MKIGEDKQRLAIVPKLYLVVRRKGGKVYTVGFVLD